jgi:hypothetical protein
MDRLLTWAVGGKPAGPATAPNGSHRYTRCRDQSCLRPLCTAHREGREDGYDDGYEDGYRAGYAAGAAAASKK